MEILFHFPGYAHTRPGSKKNTSGNFALVLKAWLMRSSFRRSHRRIPSVTRFPSGVVICLSIYHCHINFWKQRDGNGERIFSAGIPRWCTEMLNGVFIRGGEIRNPARVGNANAEGGADSFWSTSPFVWRLFTDPKLSIPAPWTVFIGDV